jgi:chromosome segregation ATPase
MPGTVADTSGGSDAQIQQLQTQLDAINAQMDAAKAARIKQAQQARAELDQTLSEFEKQVADAKALTKDNPELTAYIAAAQKFQDTTRALVDGLIHRQQQQYAQVTEIEASLHEKMEARRQEMWQKDEKLQEMNDQLAYAQRQYNAAISAGEQKEADDRKAEIELRESLIKTREDLIPDDPIYTDAVDQLQKYLDQQQKAMQEDRQTTAKALDDAQQAFADSQPAVDKLPAEQKSLATGMEERLADINAARAKYSDAASAIGDGGDDTSKKLQEQAASIAASIDAHRKQLADASLKNHRGEMEAQRQKEIEEKQAQIATLTKAAADAEAAYTGKENDRQVAEAAMEKARVAGDQLQSLNEQRMGLENQLQQLLGGLKFKQEAVNTSVQPLLITDADIHQRSDPDKRMMYMVSSSVPIGVLFAGLILLTIHGAARELPLNALSPSGEGPEPFSLVSTSNGSEGDSKELDSHDELEGVSNGESNGEPIETLNSLTGAANEADAENPRDAQPAESIQ